MGDTASVSGFFLNGESHISIFSVDGIPLAEAFTANPRVNLSPGRHEEVGVRTNGGHIRKGERVRVIPITGAGIASLLLYLSLPAPDIADVFPPTLPPFSGCIS